MITASPTCHPSAATSSSVMLTELRKAHETLLKAMSDLDELTRGPLPLRERVIQARWHISRASLARRTAWNRIHAHLAAGVGREESADLRRLQESDIALLRSSSEHISKWNIDTVMEDWPGYCLASQAIRWKMKAVIGAEKRLLYPMLSNDPVQRAQR